MFSVWDGGGCRVIRSNVFECVSVCVCVWLGEAGGITLMKNKFQKASITSAQARAPAFAFQCEVQPPLFMMLYTSKPRPASLYLAHSHSLSLSPLIPIVTTSPGSICLYGGKRQRPVGWFGTSRLLMGVNKQEVQLRRSLNYQIVILNKHLRWLMGRVFTAADNSYRWRQMFSKLSFLFFVSTGLFSDSSSCHISIYSTSNVPSLVHSFLSSCRSISLKGSSFILTYDVLCCHKLDIHTELKN